jgi:hypothetical protein
MNTLTDIEKLAKTFSDEHAMLSSIAEDLQADIDKINQRYARVLRGALDRTINARFGLTEAVKLSPELFTKPKTFTFHGIKVGFRKGTGGIDWDDDDTVVKLIEKHFPKVQADLLIKTTKKPIASAIEDLDVVELKKLGCRVEDTGDVVVAKPVDGDVLKTIKAFLASAESENSK